MKKGIILFTVVALFMVTGCTGSGKRVGLSGVRQGSIVHNVTYPSANFSNTEFKITSDDFTILQTITAESTSFNVLGIFSSGDSGYSKLYSEAQAVGADDTINIKADTHQFRFLMFFSKSTTKLTGTAIKWKQK